MPIIINSPHQVDSVVDTETSPPCLSGATIRNKDICRFLAASDRYLCHACGVLLWSLLCVHWDTYACLSPDRSEVPRVLRRSCPIFDLCAGILSYAPPFEMRGNVL